MNMLRFPRTILLRFSYRFKTPEPQAYAEFQKFMKRLRAKQPANDFSYICVVEYGTKATKRLHLHALLCCPKEVTIRSVRRHWKAGQTHGKLADIGSARYVTKYLFKDQLKSHRVRCSQKYGEPDEKIINNSTVVEVLAHFPKAKLVRARASDGGVVPRRMLKPSFERASASALRHPVSVVSRSEIRCGQIISRFDPSFAVVPRPNVRTGPRILRASIEGGGPALAGGILPPVLISKQNDTTDYTM